MRRYGRVLVLIGLAAVIPACGSGSNPKPPNTLASAPTTLTATAMSTAQIDLAWVDTSPNEFEFRIERSDDNGNSYGLVGTAPRDSVAYTDLGLLPNQTYFYRVRAWNSVGNSPSTAPASDTTKPLVWKSTIGGPGIRADHSAIYDSLGRRMILFGGQDDFFFPYNDVWALNLIPSTTAMTTPPVDCWTQLFPTGIAAPFLLGHSAIYDVQNNRMIVFGGQDDTAAYRNDVYILTLGATPAWSKPAVSGTVPSIRTGQTAVYDAANQRMVVFGGNVSEVKADLFFLSLPTSPPFVWSSGPAGPLRRTEHAAIVDGLGQRMILFGGQDSQLLPDGSTLNSETWSLNLAGTAAWTPQTFGATPFFRQGHTAIYDASNQRMILFGGDTNGIVSPVANNELWSLRLDGPAGWTFLNTTSGAPPAARYGHSAIYDGGSKRMVIYGGYDSSPFPTYSDTWITDF